MRPTDEQLAYLDEGVACAERLLERNEAELCGALPSAAAWLDVRDARNSAAHEYAIRPEQQAALLTESVEQGWVLLEQLDSALAFVRSRRSQVAGS